MRKIKSFLQRGNRGYDARDVRSPAFFFARTVCPLMIDYCKKYAEGGMYLPPQFKDDPAAWTEILRKIQRACEILLEVTKDPDFVEEVIKDDEYKELIYTEMTEGFDLLGRYCWRIIDE